MPPQELFTHLPNVGHQTLFVLDFGSQYTQLIARRLRELKIYTEILPFQTSPEELRDRQAAGLILSGGPMSVGDDLAPRCQSGIFDLGVPVLGICYGMQLMTDMLGGVVEPAKEKEFGHAIVNLEAGSSLFENLADELRVWASHGDRITKMPEGFHSIGMSVNAPIAAMEDQNRQFYGLLFHPEVVHTEQGSDILGHFASNICKCEGDWTMASFLHDAIIKIREQVGDGRVVCGLSGGVDSTVAALLISRAIGKQLTCIFVDNGLLRQDEARQIEDRFTRGELDLEILFENASERFLSELTGVLDPEEKRKRIGRTFIDVFEDVATRHGSYDFLAQGTLYPDVIESVSVIGPSAPIKSHHNVGGLPDRLNFELIEPLRALFKDEVRRLGEELGLDELFVWRQPFPGPGLAVRILGEVTEARLHILREADAIVAQEIRRSGWYRRLWQSFAVLLPIQTVGVMGDERTYEHVIAIRAVESLDGMTADWARLPEELLAVTSSRIVNEVRGVNRVVYDISSKPPSTIEWE